MAVHRTRVALLLVVLLVSVAAILIAIPEGSRRPERTPHVLAEPFSAPPDASRAPATASPLPEAACDTLVDGTSGASVEAAISAANARVICFPAGRYVDPINASVTGQTWRLDPGTVLEGQLEVTAPDMRIVGGRVESDTQDPWAESVRILADDVTIEGMTYRGGGISIAVHGRDRARILGNAFSGQIGTAIFVWGDGRGSDDVVIERNRIQQDQSLRASPISSRAADDPSEGVTNDRITIRANTVDQGDDTTGWFGVELKLSPGALIEGNRIKGGRTLISLADSDGAVVRDNDLDLVDSPHWGVELASSDGALVEANEFRGDGGKGESAVSMNSGSSNAVVKDNMVTAVGTLVDLSGDGHQVTDNCLSDVGREFAFRSSAGADIEFARNGRCV